MSEGLLSSNSSPQLFGTNNPPGSYQVCWDDTRIWFIGFLEAYQKMQILLLFALTLNHVISFLTKTNRCQQSQGRVDGGRTYFGKRGEGM